ncbi:helix-turn-helix transcriptional regulator [Chitinophaga agrisoli]|uniref:Helix-turn-helix transcriptional regulator n=1 Tax=Chitinophaga agrisoli TaxID=2607653 RepID=A0A5B2VST8_9BACT|nr:helix-turn-helix transcriptional regulator [Chitinophaga agrisoli]
MEPNINKTISANLQFLRRSNGYTRKRLAEVAETNEASINSYIEERARAPLEVLIRISDHFKLPLDELVRVDLKTRYVCQMICRMDRIDEKKLKTEE